MVSYIPNPVRAFAAALFVLAAVPAISAENYLQSAHEQRLQAARAEASAATSPSDMAEALRAQAAELDSLGKSTEALTLIDQAFKLVAPKQDRRLVATKAGILFSLNEPKAALDLLEPELAAVRKSAENPDPVRRMVGLSAFTEGFVTATFAHLQLGQWQEAIVTLSDAEAPLEGPGFYAYRSLAYRYIMARANNSSLGNARLEKSAAAYAQKDKSHYGALLRMWQGEDSASDIASVISKLSGQEQQEARVEADFYMGAYAKFVKGDDAKARQMLDAMNQLAPYGSIEWIYGKRVLQ